MDAYRQRGKGRGLKTLGLLYSTWLEGHWQHPAFAFVQEAFNRYLTSRFPPVRSIVSSQRYKEHPDLAGQFAYVDVCNAARLLGASPPKIKRLIRDGLLDVYPESDPSGTGRFLYRHQLEALRAAQPPVPDRPPPSRDVPRKARKVIQDTPANRISKREAAAGLGVQPTLLNDLLACGPLIPTGRRHRGEEFLSYLTPDDLDTFRQGLKRWIVPQAQPAQGSVLLNQAAIMNGKVGLGQTGLIKRVLAGQLTAYHPAPDLQPLAALWVETHVVLGLTQQVREENGWVSFLETAALLGVSRAVLHHWVNSGRLVPVASFARAQYFLRTAVLDLRERCMTSDEAALMLGTSRGALGRWAQAGYLHPLSGPGTDRPGRYRFDRLEPGRENRPTTARRGKQRPGWVRPL